MCGVLCFQLLSAWDIANSGIRVGRLHRFSTCHFHDQVLFVAALTFTHLIAHATIAPSPYQDSLRRDGGQARWVLGTGYEISFCAFQFVSGTVRSHFRGLE